MTEQEVIVKEADLEDAGALAQALKEVAIETSFLTRDDDSDEMTEDQASQFIASKGQLPNNLCLVAKLGNEVIGVLNIAGSSFTRTEHIGDLFIAVRKPYWGQGIGQVLMEEAISWAQHSGIIRRLELTVQKRNEKAVYLYQKFGFEIEGLKKRGAKTKKGEFLDVYLMGRLIDM